MLMYRCDTCRRVIEVVFVGWDHQGPGLRAEYRCRAGHLFLVGAHQVQPQRVTGSPPGSAVAGPAGS